jgi:regulator of RNase E activity RraA
MLAFVVVCLFALFVAADARGQINSLTREELIKYTAPNPFDRFPDGRPKVPDALLEAFKDMSSEEVMGAGRSGGGAPAVAAPGRAGGQAGLDVLQPGDVLVIDCGGSQVAGLYGDMLVYYLWKKTGTGFVIDGYIRDLEGIATYDMAGYFRGAVPEYQTGTMLTGINVPIRIGKATVMPGDVVFGDREGVNFIPPQAVQRIVDGAKTTHIHDEWTRKRFDEGKYKSTDIYSSPRDPALRQEYQEYLKQQLEKQK